VDIQVRKFEGTHIIDVGGEVDMYNAHRLKELIAAMVQKQVAIFILNLNKVTYVDSSGIGALLSIIATLAREGMAFRIVNVARPVMRVIELTKLVGFLPILGSELEAIESVVGKKAASRRAVPSRQERDHT
jgi:anti-sigma B factor antagonist